jgi:hypothetical protein
VVATAVRESNAGGVRVKHATRDVLDDAPTMGTRLSRSCFKRDATVATRDSTTSERKHAIERLITFMVFVDQPSVATTGAPC